MEMINKTHAVRMKMVLFMLTGILLWVTNAGIIWAAADTSPVRVVCTAPLWDSQETYTKGDQVSYNGILYEAYHWTQNQNPETNNSEWGPWVNKGPCDGGGSNQSPTVSLTAPGNNTSYTAGDNVTISATASDVDGSITRVEFLVDGLIIASDAASPYTTNWTATEGTHTLTARATDDDGASTLSATVTITVSQGSGNQSPVVSMTSPADGSSFIAGQGVTLSANASDTDGSVSKVAFYVDGNLLSEDFSDPYGATWAATEGNHALTAIATDNAGATGISPAVNITVTPDGGGSCDAPQYVENGGYQEGSRVQNEGSLYECRPWPNSGWCNGAAWAYAPGMGDHWEDAWTLVGPCDGNPGNQSPSVSITQPASGTSFQIGQLVNIEATASDGDGTVSKVEFFVDGSRIGEDLSSPYTISWTAVQGNHTLTATATDNLNATGNSAPINISVGSVSPPVDLPARIMNGYWHNFDNGSTFFPLREVSSNWDVINVSFAVARVSPTDGEIEFRLDPAFSELNYFENDFKSDIRWLQDRGKKVIISIGGAEGQIRLNTGPAREKFVTSMISIIEEYGFDGMDIDFEGQSLSFDLGDTDFRNPTTPVIVNTIQAIERVCNHFGDDFILTMAPETFFVQLGYSFYGGISVGADRRAGAYLPLIHALRDKLTFLQVQYYNSGPITGLDDQFHIMGDANFYVALVDMLLRGFPITGDADKFFPPLRPDQILIGVPAFVQAGGGYTGPQGVINALDHIINGTSFGGQYYQLSRTYPDLRGVMSWSVNWDLFDNLSFSNPVRAYLDGLAGTPVARQYIPGSARSEIAEDVISITGREITLQLDEPSFTTIELYNVMGVPVRTVVDDHLSPGQYRWTITEGLAAGIYIVRISAGNSYRSSKILKP